MDFEKVYCKLDFEEINPLDFMDVLKTSNFFDDYGLRVTKIQRSSGGGSGNLKSVVNR